MKGAFKSMNTGLKGVGDKLSLTKGKYTDGLVGNRLEELIRKATAKNLPGPDATLNTQVRRAQSAGPSLYAMHLLLSQPGA